MSKPKKKPATKARPKENAALSGRDQGKERSEQPDASAVAEATIFAKPSWHDPDRVAKVTLRFVTLGVEDEAAVDRALKLLDLIDRKTLAREKERAEEIKRLEEEANTPSHLDFRHGVVFITGQQRPDRAEANFVEYLVCWNLLVCPIDDMKEEAARSLRGLNQAMGSYLERKKHEGFDKAELLSLQATFRVWLHPRPGVRKLRRNMQKLSESAPNQGGEGSLSEPPEKN